MAGLGTQILTSSFINYSTNQIGALGNGKGYSNPEVDKLLERAVSETVVQEERAKLYQEALKLILADVPRIELEATQTVAGVNKKYRALRFLLITPYKLYIQTAQTYPLLNN